MKRKDFKSSIMHIRQSQLTLHGFGLRIMILRGQKNFDRKSEYVRVEQVS